MKRIKHFTLVTLILGIASGPFGAVSGSEKGAAEESQRLLKQIEKDGFELFYEPDPSIIPKGEIKNFVDIPLLENHIYYIVAAGCEDAYDVDVVVLDEFGNLIGKDNDNDRTAVVRVSPLWSGKFMVRVTMFHSTKGGAHSILKIAKMSKDMSFKRAAQKK